MSSRLLVSRTSTLDQVVRCVAYDRSVVERYCVTAGHEDASTVTNATSALVESDVALGECGRSVLDQPTALTADGVVADPGTGNGDRAVVVDATALIGGCVAFDQGAVYRDCASAIDVDGSAPAGSVIFNFAFGDVHDSAATDVNGSGLPLAATCCVAVDFAPGDIRRRVTVDPATTAAVVALVAVDSAVLEVERAAANDDPSAGSAGGTPRPTGNGHIGHRDGVGLDLDDRPVISSPAADDGGLAIDTSDGQRRPDDEASGIGPCADVDDLTARGGGDRGGDRCVCAATGTDSHRGR